MRKFGIFIQCRLSSRRLPAKALLPLGGHPILVVIIKRAMALDLPVFVLTSSLPSDDVIEYLALKAGAVDVIRGDIHDVRSRFLECAIKHNIDFIIRLTADNPFFDTSLLLSATSLLLDGSFGYISGSFVDIPEGTNVEAFCLSHLLLSFKKSSLDYDKEHVTPWIRMNSACDMAVSDTLEGFSPSQVECLRQYSFTIDTFHHYVQLCDLYECLGSSTDIFESNILSRLYNTLLSGFSYSHYCIRGGE